MNQIEHNSTPTPTTTTATSRRLSLDSGMDRLRGKLSAADLSNQARAPTAAVRPHHRLLDLYHGSHASTSNHQYNYNNNNSTTTSRQRRRAQAAWAEADLLLATAAGNVEITGLELLMMCDEMTEFDYYKATTERDYDDDSISMVSYEISCSSMDSIANDSIDLARERQQRRSKQYRSHSISLLSVSAEEGEERISYHPLESRSSDSCKVSNDSASCSSKSVYSILFSSAEQLVQDISETVTINTNGTNRAA